MQSLDAFNLTTYHRHMNICKSIKIFINFIFSFMHLWAHDIQYLIELFEAFTNYANIYLLCEY